MTQLYIEPEGKTHRADVKPTGLMPHCSTPNRVKLSSLAKLRREALDIHVAELQALVAEFRTRLPGKGSTGVSNSSDSPLP